MFGVGIVRKVDELSQAISNTERVIDGIRTRPAYLGSCGLSKLVG